MSDASYTQVTGKLDCNKCVWGTRDGGCASWECEFIDRDDAVKAWRNMPSTEPKIIRCKCCEYGDQDEVGRWFCRGLGCQIGDEDGSGFCADAERRKDA